VRQKAWRDKAEQLKMARGLLQKSTAAAKAVAAAGLASTA
jgi:hypothetical protein